MHPQVRNNFRIQASYSRGRTYLPYCRNWLCLALLIVVLAIFVATFKANPTGHIRPTFATPSGGPHDHTGGPAKRAIKFVKLGITDSTYANEGSTLTFHPILLMVCFALLVSFLYIKLLGWATQTMLYSSVFLIAVLMLWWALMRFLFGMPLLGLVVILLTVAYLAAVWFYFRHHYQSAVVMVRLTTQFLSEQFTLMVVPICLIAIGYLFFKFTVNGVNSRHHSLFGALISMFLMLLYCAFFFLFFFYVMVYLVSNRVADWYYGRPSGCCEGLGRLLRNHLGTIMMATVLIPFVKTNQVLVWILLGDPYSSRTQVLWPFLGSCLQSLFSSLYTLNDLAIILCTQTGHNFLDSASTAGVVVLDNFGLFSALDSLGVLITAAGVVVSTVVPAFLHAVLLNAFEWYGNLAESVHSYDIGYVCGTVGLTVLLIFYESLLAIYLFHCFEKELNKFGIGFPDFNLKDPRLSSDYLIQGSLQGIKPMVILNTAMELDGNLVYRPLVVDQQPQQRNVQIQQEVPVAPPPYPQAPQSPVQYPSQALPRPSSPILQAPLGVRSSLPSRQNSAIQQPPIHVQRSNYPGVNYPSI